MYITQVAVGVITHLRIRQVPVTELSVFRFLMVQYLLNFNFDPIYPRLKAALSIAVIKAALYQLGYWLIMSKIKRATGPWRISSYADLIVQPLSMLNQGPNIKYIMSIIYQSVNFAYIQFNLRARVTTTPPDYELEGRGGGWLNEPKIRIIFVYSIFWSYNNTFTKSH